MKSVYVIYIFAALTLESFLSKHNICLALPAILRQQGEPEFQPLLHQLAMQGQIFDRYACSM